ncbi:unnamed protein product, partial [Pylaiella littoralis]
AALPQFCSRGGAGVRVGQGCRSRQHLPQQTARCRCHAGGALFSQSVQSGGAPPGRRGGSPSSRLPDPRLQAPREKQRLPHQDRAHLGSHVQRRQRTRE